MDRHGADRNDADLAPPRRPAAGDDRGLLRPPRSARIASVTPPSHLHPYGRTQACLRDRRLSRPHHPGPASKPRRGQGQWALGYREPLNPNERSKRDDDPLNVRQRILDIYSKQGFDSIDPGDLRGRFRWMGLYTQRQQGIPGGQTATLEPEELEAPILHDAGAHRRRCAHQRAAARRRRHLDRVRPRRRRRQRPAERPAALDPHRGRAGDLAPARGRRAVAPPRPAATARASCSAARSRASPSTR